MRTIDGESRADFTLDVVCDHRSDPACNEPERLVAVVYHIPKPPNVIGFINWRAARLVTDGVEQDNPHTTFYGEIMRLTKNMSSAQRSEILRSPLKEDQLLSRNGGQVMGSNSWNFRCADCTFTAPARYETLTPKLELLRERGAQRLTLHGLAYMLKP